MQTKEVGSDILKLYCHNNKMKIKLPVFTHSLLQCRDDDIILPVMPLNSRGQHSYIETTNSIPKHGVIWSEALLSAGMILPVLPQEECL